MKKKLWIVIGIIAVLLAVTILFASLLSVALFSFRIAYVIGPSMRNTLHPGDRVLSISRMFYLRPKAGDVVLFSKDSYENGELAIKRIIATEGQTVDIDFGTGTVYVDGVALQEDYISTGTTHFEGVIFPIVVEDDCYFVMGDNRENSLDSRSPQVGFVKDNEIIGKVILILFPDDAHESDNRLFCTVE